MKKIYLHSAKSQIARPTDIRDINRRIVLNYVRERAPISRAEIARQTNLQRSSVSAIIDNLQMVGLIEEIGEGASSGGRKPTLLKLRSKMPVAFGIDVTPRSIQIALADLEGEVLDGEMIEISPDLEFISDQILSGLARIIDRTPALPHDISVGISLPGIADYGAGKSVYIPHFDWKNWNIASRIVRKFGFSVIIDNDANAVALAELWFSRKNIRKYSSFISLLIGEGVGAGIVFDGQIYRGSHGAAGEFGHLLIGSDAPVPCSCGSRRCWEAHASEKAALARYFRAAAINQPTTDEESFSQLIGLANLGDEIAFGALNETAKFIGFGLSVLIVGLSPQAVVLSGTIVRAWNLIGGEISTVVRRTIRTRYPETAILPSSLGNQPTLIGAVTLSLAKKFSLAD